jgi:branched-chain amino acid transport system permease protein
MEYLLQQLINGVTLGAIYGLIALGYTMVYGVLGMINFAHGEIYMIGAFLSLMGFALLGTMGWPIVIVILVVLLAAMLIAAAWGWSLERIAYRPLRGSPRLVPLISAIGMSIFLQNLVQLVQGARVKTMPPLINGGIELLHRVEDGFSVTISYTQILLWSVTAVLVLLFAYLIKHTSLGRAQRAVSQDLRMAEYLGINSNRTISITFIIAAMLAAVAGCMVMLYYGVADFYLGFLAGIKAFTAAVLGGIGSLPGALLGGLLIGLIESLWSAYFSIEYKDVAAFLVLFLVLLIRPSGFFGRPSVEKV